MCSSSSGRPFTQNHTGFVWFKNRQVLYQDWSPWYQELVSGEEAVTYSCAVKGYEGFRAPEVSVDLVTSTCFRVTYAESSMCSSVNKQCSIMFPKEIYLQQTRIQHDHVRLTCNSSCSLTEPQASIVLIKNKKEETKPITVPLTSADTFTCSVKDMKDFHSADVCFDNSSCWTVTCFQKRICALKGSSLNIYCKYSHPHDQPPKSKLWFKINRNINQEEQLKEKNNKVTFYESPNQANLTFKKLSKSDSGEYVFRIERNSREWKEATFPEVTLIVTDLRVKIRPSAEVTEGQKVTLTCSTSCPLTQNSNFRWYLNHQPLKLENKHLVIDAVTSQDAGNYSCVDKTKEDSMSPVKTLTVTSASPKTPTVTSASPKTPTVTSASPKTLTVTSASPKTPTVTSSPTTWKAVVGVSAIVFVSVCLIVFLWIRRKRTSAESSRLEVADKLEKLNPDHVYEEIPAEAADCELHYSQVNFENTIVYSTIQAHQEQEHVRYAITKFRQNSDQEMVNDVV
uniref:Ig-like domain-containing protein n=1 Tax=Oryzias latipes TaxID=8090 RepID=A0A3P9KHZ0_ORYLA